MNEEPDNVDARGPAIGNDGFEGLFRHTMPRQHPPESEERRIRESLHAEWSAVVGRRIRIARVAWMAVAASVLLAVGAALVALRPGLLFEEPVVVARLERVIGAVELSAGAGQSASGAVQQDTELIGGQIVTTMNGRVSARLAEGGSLRMTVNTRVRLISSTEIELVRGALYFASEDSADQVEQLRVRTRLGSLRDVGTQFIARLDPETLVVSVREGAVAIDGGNEPIEAATGQRVNVSGSGTVSRESIALHGEEWAWAEQLAPAYDMDGHTLGEFLAWSRARRVVAWHTALRKLSRSRKTPCCAVQ